MTIRRKGMKQKQIKGERRERNTRKAKGMWRNITYDEPPETSNAAFFVGRGICDSREEFWTFTPVG